jgi:hypothetical protein
VELYSYSPVCLHGVDRDNFIFTDFATNERYSLSHSQRRQIKLTQIQFLARGTISDIKCSEVTPKCLYKT